MIRSVQPSKFRQHKYAINAELLGDLSDCPWTNLGYWSCSTTRYPEAGQALAQHLVAHLALQPHDRLLDLGCGQGASLKLWQQHFKVKSIQAVELQPECVHSLLEKFVDISIYQRSFLDLNDTEIQPADVVVCIDAAYHCNIRDFLSAIDAVIQPKGRLAFHYLCVHDKWHDAGMVKKLQHQLCLAAADVQIKHLMTMDHLNRELQQFGYQHVEIVDISDTVLKGFADYAQQLPPQQPNLDLLKIKMTAKLCAYLYAQGLIRYVQVNASK